MVGSHQRTETVVEAPASSVWRMPTPAGRVGQAETELAAAVREAVTAVLLHDWPRGLGVAGADPDVSDGARERSAAWARRASELERRLAERGGWDEV